MQSVRMERVVFYIKALKVSIIIATVKMSKLLLTEIKEECPRFTELVSNRDGIQNL